MGSKMNSKLILDFESVSRLEWRVETRSENGEFCDWVELQLCTRHSFWSILTNGQQINNNIKWLHLELFVIWHLGLSEWSSRNWKNAWWSEQLSALHFVFTTLHPCQINQTTNQDSSHSAIQGVIFQIPYEVNTEASKHATPQTTWFVSRLRLFLHRFLVHFSSSTKNVWRWWMSLTKHKIAHISRTRPRMTMINVRFYF